MTTQSLMQVQTNRDGVVSRRTFFRSIAAGAAGMGLMESLAVHAQELRRRDMSCILLFMNGGPSQFETFDPKPGHANGGPTEAIDTAVNGIRIADSWPQVAREMGSIALVRSMTNREGEHQSRLPHAYRLSAGRRRPFPSVGSLVANEIASNSTAPLRADRRPRLRRARSVPVLGMQYALRRRYPKLMPANVQLPGRHNQGPALIDASI